jgi:hypothetical protein
MPQKMTPTFPLISICKDAIEIIDGSYPLDKTNLLGVLQYSASKCLYYDKEGNVWSSTISSEKHKPTFLNKLLANTFYNLSITIQRSWAQYRHYELQELKESISGCIDKDDDILTQFVEGSKLKQRVSSCTDFDAVVNTLLKYVFQPDEEQINKEFPVEE